MSRRYIARNGRPLACKTSASPHWKFPYFTQRHFVGLQK